MATKATLAALAKLTGLRDGVLALFIPRAERDKPRKISIG